MKTIFQNGGKATASSQGTYSGNCMCKPTVSMNYKNFIKMRKCRTYK